MRLFEIINYLKSVQQAEKLIAIEIPNVEFGLIDVYLKDKLHVESDVKFFDVDTIPNKLERNIEGVNYINLFPLAMTQEMVEDYSNAPGEKLSDKEIAQRLIDYWIKDA